MSVAHHTLVHSEVWDAHIADATWTCFAQRIVLQRSRRRYVFLIVNKTSNILEMFPAMYR